MYSQAELLHLEEKKKYSETDFNNLMVFVKNKKNMFWDISYLIFMSIMFLDQNIFSFSYNSFLFFIICRRGLGCACNDRDGCSNGGCTAVLKIKWVKQNFQVPVIKVQLYIHWFCVLVYNVRLWMGGGGGLYDLKKLPLPYSISARKCWLIKYKRSNIFEFGDHPMFG